MITIPVYLFVAQWVLLAVLALLVIALYRQLGNYLGVGAGKEHSGLEPGTPAVPFDYMSAGLLDSRGHFDPAQVSPALLVFADPSCQACEHVAAMLGARPPEGVKTLVVTTEPAPIIAASPAFAALPHVGIVKHDVVRRYHVDQTPYIFAISRDGVVSASGPVTTADEIDALASAATGRRAGNHREEGALYEIR